MRTPQRSIIGQEILCSDCAFVLAETWWEGGVRETAGLKF